MSSQFKDAAPTVIAAAFQALLTEKHLYQYVELDTDFIAKIAGLLSEDYIAGSGPTSHSYVPTFEEIRDEGMEVLDERWIPLDPTEGEEPRYSETEIYFSLPTIHAFCSDCEQLWPFNPLYDGLYCTAYKKTTSQWFFLSYQCQSCKGCPVRFLVRRDGLKLRLVGRDPLEVLPLPKCLPKAQSKYYSNAVIAHHAGQTLAGLFLLRVFIEQFWQTVPQVKKLMKQKQGRATGDEQGAAYQQTLPDDFKSRFPSLADVYGQLSAAMHTAEASATIFDEARRKIEEHFDAKRLYKIT
jgi:hypothetical protein